MNQVCPVTFKQVDENAAKINALLSALSIVLFLVTSYKFILIFLTIDFFIRGFIDPLYSYYSAISKSFLRILKKKPKLIERKPKMFAAKMGFLFSLIILIVNYYNLEVVTFIVSAMLVFFALLEGIFGFCVGCKIYAIFERIKKTQHN